MDPDQFCRDVEGYLCQKNDGHLIRIAGPSFERVSGWATQGIPFKIACLGIDRYFERYYAKGRRRRPVHIDFCEADVLDAFDAWRRAVGVRLTGFAQGADEATAGVEPASHSRRPGLAAHLARVLERVTAMRMRDNLAPALAEALTAILQEPEFTSLPSVIRGDARARVLARLAALDAELMTAVRTAYDSAELRSLQEEAVLQLAPFRERMESDVYAGALAAAVDRLIRERERLPTLALE